jgi:hypothetical protein
VTRHYTNWINLFTVFLVNGKWLNLPFTVTWLHHTVARCRHHKLLSESHEKLWVSV